MTTLAELPILADVSDVTPEMVRAYLRARGWCESDFHGDCLEFTNPGGARFAVDAGAS